jgi:NADP-dependent 3-hydroxy acid dehydrogenase YdfG
VATELLHGKGRDPKALEMLKKFPSLQPENIANGVLYVLSTPPDVQIHELTIQPMGEAF